MIEPIYIYLDESGTDTSSPFLVLSLVVIEEPDSLKKKIEDLIKSVIKDPEISNMNKIKDGIETFHYTEDNHEVRNKYIELLPQLNYDAYCSFINNKKLDPSLSKLNYIHKLFGVLISSILQKHHHKDIFIVYESIDEGSEKIKKSFELLIDNIRRKIQDSTGVKISNVNFEFKNKEEILLSIPDYLAGITKDYLKAREDNMDTNSFQVRNYLRVNGKIRVLNDYLNNKFYTRGENI
jgi:hypothetical protein